jgi:Domain of unknown function DUF11/PEP-CTERM motif
MTSNKSVRSKRGTTPGRILLGVAVLMAMWVSQTAAQAGPIVLDGVGDDWDPAWQVATDPLDVYLTDLGTHPHDPPIYARSGYDAIGLWAHYQADDGRWYFRIDMDGRAGDADSQIGTANNFGVGTHGPDQGPLVVPPFEDGVGLGTSEAYKLGFQCASGGEGSTAALGPGEEILPGVVSPTTAGLPGQGVYGTTVPGVVECAFDRETLFPEGSTCGQLWLSAQVGDNNDRVSDDQVAATLVMALDLVVLCPETPIVVDNQATFSLQYGIPASAKQGASDVVLTAVVPDGTTFVGASNGGTESNGVITWELGDLAPGSSGEVSLTLRVNEPAATLTINSEITCAEGLRYQASNRCPVQQPQPTPPDTGVPPVVPEPATVTLMLAGLGGLAGYAALQWRARRRR